MKRVMFVVAVDMPDDESSSTVTIHASGPHPLSAQMCAVEHMMTMFANSSSAGFERALELLCEGARSNQVKQFKPQ